MDNDKPATIELPKADRPVRTPLYKFRAPTPAHISALSKSELYFAAPKDFNDPFDTALHLGTQEEELEAAIGDGIDPRTLFQRSTAVELFEGVSDSVLNLFNDRLMGLFNEQTGLLQDLKESHAGRLSHTLDRVGILSLSATMDSVLLWAHYAAGHSGFCLEFRNLEKHLKEVRFYEVDYRVEFVPLVLSPEILTSPSVLREELLTPALRRTLATKSRDWSYECEWRGVIPQASIALTYPPECLERVVFGVKTQPEAVRRVRTVLGGPSWGHVRFEQATARPGAFALDFIPL